ncbi:carbonic anhydrase family protein [Pediococcus acidilactici]|uniref:carbonic anhydrase family protein n=1 Tax=Pediococcus acidilactici TaxID=1254 RepID=UPI000FF6F4B9|nr:carbonic anhydrase family protein [Pediococcus acidilactici]MCH9266935.1 carbonic anhydrase family protein [Pediococcus acidilactici]MCK2074938.1 carbonic anhydrase family protein [Pediococcus acidilactici]MDV2602661.1 carbonic anhydrase family protein [Pediococcus acidilactici]MDV2844085.1 carbonic anhydrase family protein [Pediococcus acidilactici]QOP72853.1 carbonic anhydrase family protein [Pediococcus acidilactici]
MRKLNYNHQDQWKKEDRTTQSPILIEKAELEGKQNQVISRTKPYAATEVHNNLNNLSLTANGEIKSDRRRFQLMEVHFHHPAEHRFEGEAEPRVLEAHFVHYGSLKQPLVVSVTFKIGLKNEVFEKILDAMEDGAVTQPLILEELIPQDGNFYRYIGSLTTPPLTEGVEWLVFENAPTINLQQLNRYTAVFAAPNNRALQNLNGRSIEKYEL